MKNSLQRVWKLSPLIVVILFLSVYLTRRDRSSVELVKMSDRRSIVEAFPVVGDKAEKVIPARQEKKSLQPVEREHLPSSASEDPALDAGLEFFDSVAALPGAYDLAWDIRSALEENPGAIDFSQISFGPERDYEIRDNYLEYMIPDPDLRAKWIALMAIIADVSG